MTFFSVAERGHGYFGHDKTRSRCADMMMPVRVMLYASLRVVTVRMRIGLKQARNIAV